jgi:FkbH-like protein
LGSIFRFTIGATFTAEPLQPAIHFWARQLNLDFEIRFAPYNQIEQTLLDPRGEFASNTHGANFIALRLEDFGGFELARIGSNIEHFLEALGRAPLGAPTILCLCQPSRAFLADTERGQAAAALAERIANAVSSMRGVQSLDYRQIEEYYPVAEYEAPGGEQLGHVPYTETYYAALATALVRRSHATSRAPYKVIALDCDDTLWQGVCGEDVPGGITLDAPRVELQRFMAERRNSGFLLSLASKNNETDVLEAFERHPEMPLGLRDFAAWRINWDSKADNLAGLARELNVGLDSFIFVDDNPKECAELESSVPEVLSVPLPAELEETGHFLRHIWAFDVGVVTGEDRKRSESYSRNREFGSELRAAWSLSDFLARLGLEVRIAPLAPAEVERVAQLTKRTNQFNFTTIRRSEAEIERLVKHGGYECFTVHVTDRFGDYGLTGAVLTAARGGELMIDTFLLSCRVLGRGVEHQVMAFLAGYASERGVKWVVARFEQTAKNAPARQFLDSIGTPDEGGAYRLSLETICELEWKPEATVKAAPPTSSASTPVRKQAAPDYVRIARTLSTPAQILAEIRSATRGTVVMTANPPSTETERQLAEIWADLLHTPAISASDNFFDLGGHSLLAVLLLVRIQETFAIELSIDDVYSGALTLADLAQRIDLLRLGDPDSPEYAELLREIEALSEEEARQMLGEGEQEAERL